MAQKELEQDYGKPTRLSLSPTTRRTPRHDRLQSPAPICAPMRDALPDQLVVPTGRRGKKRKAGDMALDDTSSHSELRKAARKNALILGLLWFSGLVEHNEKTNLKRVNRTTSSSSSSATPTLGSYNRWAFDFKPAPVIMMMPAGYFDPVVPPQDGYSWGSVHGRPIPRGFALTKLVVGRQALTTRRVGLSVIQGWRYWMLENKVAGTDRVPVGPYRNIA